MRPIRWIVSLRISILQFVKARIIVEPWFLRVCSLLVFAVPPVLIAFKLIQVVWLEGNSDWKYALSRRLDDPSLWYVVATGLAGVLILLSQALLHPRRNPQSLHFGTWQITAVAFSIGYIVTVAIRGETFFAFRDPTMTRQMCILQFVEGLVILFVIVSGTLFLAAGLSLVDICEDRLKNVAVFAKTRIDRYPSKRDETVIRLEAKLVRAKWAAAFLRNAGISPNIVAFIAYILVTYITHSLIQYKPNWLSPNPYTTGAALVLQATPFAFLSLRAWSQLRRFFKFQRKSLLTTTLIVGIPILLWGGLIPLLGLRSAQVFMISMQSDWCRASFASQGTFCDLFIDARDDPLTLTWWAFNLCLAGVSFCRACWNRCALVLLWLEKYGI